jgi:hypothetical protein
LNQTKLYLAALLVVASLIVAPSFAFVNSTPNSNVAEGSPLPPPVPNLAFTSGAPAFIAEGSPLPPPVPNAITRNATSVMVAEGSPLPPPVPNSVALLA